MDFSGKDKASGVKFAWWFRGVVDRESPILGDFAPQKPKIGPIGNHRKYCLECISLSQHKRHATDTPFVEYRVAIFMWT